MAFEQVDIDRLEQLEEEAEQGKIDKQMRPYYKWLRSIAEKIQEDRENNS